MLDLGYIRGLGKMSQYNQTYNRETAYMNETVIRGFFPEYDTKKARKKGIEMARMSDVPISESHLQDAYTVLLNNETSGLVRRFVDPRWETFPEKIIDYVIESLNGKTISDPSYASDVQL